MSAIADTPWTVAEREAWVWRELALDEWAEASIELPETSPEPGPLDVDRTPYLRPIMRAYSAPHVREITWLAGSQLAKTTMELCIIGYHVDQAPAEILFLMGRDEDAESLSVNRFEPIVTASPALKAHQRSPRDITKEIVRLGSTRCYFDTATSAAAVSSRPIEVALLDELHLHPTTIAGEGPPYDLAKKRVSNYVNSKLVGTSTLTDEEMIGWKLYLAGSRLRWALCCPHCRALQYPQFCQIKWPKDARDAERIHGEMLAWYECEACAGTIGEDGKEWTLQHGAYVSEKAVARLAEAEGVNLEKPGPAMASVVTRAVEEPESEGGRGPHQSFWVSGIVSPWRTWSGIAAEFLKVKDDPERLRSFHNTTLGENWVDQVTALKDQSFADARAEHKKTEIPDWVQFVTIGADWHGEKKGFYWTICGFGAERQAAVIDYGNEETLAGLADVFARDLKGLPMRGGVDSGWDTASVYDFVRPLYPVVWPTKGNAQLRIKRLQDSPIEYFAKGRRMVYKNFHALHFQPDMIKDTVAVYLEGGPELVGRIVLPEDVGDDFIKHMKGEHKVRVDGQMVWRKRYHGAPNHWWDCLVICVALGLRWGWERLGAKRAARAAGVRMPEKGPRFGVRRR